MAKDKQIYTREEVIKLLHIAGNGILNEIIEMLAHNGSIKENDILDLQKDLQECDLNNCDWLDKLNFSKNE